MFRLQKTNKARKKEYNDLSDFLTQNPNLKIVKTYRDFFLFMKSLCPVYQERKFYVHAAETGVIIEKEKVDSPDGEFIVVYEFESDTIKKLFYRIFRLKDNSDRSATYVISSFSNCFNFVIDPGIMSVIFRYNELKDKKQNAYHTFQITSPNGKVRNIVAPEDTLKTYLQECNELFQKIFDSKNIDFQVAYKKGKNVRDNAEIHKNNPYIFNMDLKDFYPSCKRELVSDALEYVFEKIFNGETLKTLFLNAILYNDALFIGSPISGCLANEIISKPAKYMKNIAKKKGMEFSVYADDITLSSYRYISKKFAQGFFQAGFSKFNLETYFFENEKKSHGASKHKRRITGVSINNKNQMTVSRDYYRSLRFFLFKLSKNESIQISINQLRGKIAYATMVDESGKIVKLLSDFKSTVTSNNLVSSEKLKELGV